jgi:hypothetical protein
MRPLKRFQSSGRWFFGSHWPKSSRWLKKRSFARAFSSSRRAPPMAAVDLACLDGVEQGDGLEGVAGGVGPGLFLHPPLLDRLLHRSDDEAGAEFLDVGVAVFDGFGKIVPGVDVEEGERNARRPEGLAGEVGDDN